MPQDELTVIVEYDTVAVQIDEPTVPIGVTLISNMGPPGPQGPQGDPGPAGVDGATGPQGDPGPAGADGADGSIWYSGSGVPASGTGIDGDYYLNIDTGDVYQKSSGSWGSPIENLTGPSGADGATGPQGDPGPAGADGATGPQGDPGPAGADGADGATWHSGSGIPASGIGVVNDWYFDITTGDVYLKTDAVTWTFEINLVGPTGSAGADGSTWYSGSGAPSSGVGVDGDYYFRTDTGDVYQKSGGAWGSPIANLTGPAGSGGSGATPSDGWIDDTSETWTYASGSGGGTATFTVPGDVTTKYTVGTRIKLTQTTVKYFVVSVDPTYDGTNTTVTITAGDDYTLDNVAISDNYHSYAANPQGYPGWFNYTPTINGVTAPTSEARFCILGRLCTVDAYVRGTSNATTKNFTLPVAMIPSSLNSHGSVSSQSVDNGAPQTTSARVDCDRTGLAVAYVYRNVSGGGWTASGTWYIVVLLPYVI